MRQLRKTKIICTIGPATDREEMLEKLISAGMDVARVNFSHGSYSEHQDTINRIKAVREKCQMPIAIMLDTKGPEFRVKQFKNNSVTLNDGQDFILTSNEVDGDETRVSVTYKGLAQDLEENDEILANDGLIKLKVKKILDTDIHCSVVKGGKLSNNKSLNFPGKNLKMEYLSDNDKRDLLFGIENDVDYVACSFVSCAKDIKSVRKFLDKNGGENIDLIAKIENQSGIDNLKSILKYCVGAMVARGDLGVEIPFHQLPSVQKQIIRKCSKFGKIAITATEMLESMIEKPRPTRAEVSDVGNAVFDGSCAIMLSGETAMGKYPIEAVEIMSQIALSSELSKAFPYRKRKEISIYDHDSRKSAIAHGTFVMADDSGADIILNFTESGMGSVTLSHFRSKINIVSAAYNMKEFNKLSLYWGVTPFYVNQDSFTDMSAAYFYYIEQVIRYFNLKKGDKIVACYGWIDGTHDFSNGIKIFKVK